MPVTEVFSLPEFNNILAKADKNRLIVVDFFATWCGPCRMISPYFEGISSQYTNATFLKVNVDQARDISTHYRVSAMPTFLFFKNKNQVDMVRGANQNGIQSAIQKHYSTTPANPNAASDEERKFLESLTHYTEKRKFYTDEVFKALARSVMPEALVEKAFEENVDEKLVLKELLEWFKYKFFTWCDSPSCPKCTLKCTNQGLQGTPSREEAQDGADRVEVFICEACNTDVRFPRYNNPAKLLQTRTGRCGEWANCFSLLLSALNLEARFVLDRTVDHVWNEVYLKDEKRWIHVDPCENTMDQPLMYTRGWKRNIRYCIGYGIDHVADVTWRYVYDSKKVAKERIEVRAAVLENFLSKLNARQMEGLTEERKKELALRRVCELLEMIAEEKKNHEIGWEKLGENMGGRTTGSEEWRRARGELGSAAPKSDTPKLFGKPINLTANSENYAEFSYDIIKNIYSTSTEKGFISQAFECKNIQRKEELDWKQVYLCRENGKENGEISWHINLESLTANSSKSIEKIEIQMMGIRKWEKANAMVIACLGDTCMKIPASGNLTIDEPMAGVLKITANLIGGEGDQAFQHAQIFRTESDTDDERTNSLLVKIWLKE
ncbi:unnamed protein product [Caenorhabditis brenneri]